MRRVILSLAKLWAFIRRDFLSMVSYRLAFILQVFGMFFTMGAFFFMTKMMDPKAEGLNGIPPFDYLLIGLAFLSYFSTALYAFASRVRNEQMIGTLEAMLVSPTRTHFVVFASATWDFTYGAFRIVLYLLLAVLVFGVTLNVHSPIALMLGVALTLLSSAGVGILSASFIIYFKRGDPINFMLSGATTFFGSVFFPVEQLPDWAEPAGKLVPLSWSLQVVRGSLLQGKSLSDLSEPLTILFVLTLVLLPSGLWASRFAIRKAKREGSLIQY
jgi:ABC-2 type transport system permease protein